MMCRWLGIALFFIYISDVLTKKLIGRSAEFVLPEVASFLLLFISVGFLLVSILPDLKKLD